MLLAQDIKDINGVLVLALLHTSVLFSELLVLESAITDYFERIKLLVLV